MADRRPRLPLDPATRRRWLLRIAPLAIALLLGGLLGVAFAAAIHRPRVETVSDFTPGLITQFTTAGGEVFATFARERRIMLREGEVPEVLQQAVMAAEDASFLEHGGVDAAGVVRAALRNAVSGEIVQGASTITMQLARHLFLTRERTWKRKVEEAFLSVELEKNLSKQQILTLYCNVVYLGHGNYGMAAAARDFFGKGVDELDLAEAATLAGIIQTPSRFSPYRRPDLVIERRDYVLRRMREEGFIDEGAYRAAAAQPLMVVRRRPERPLGPYFAEEIRRTLEQRYGTERLLEGGLQVATTLEPAIQRAAEEALRAGLARLDHRRGWRGPIDTLEGEEPEEAELEEWEGRELVPGLWSRGIVLEAHGATARVKVGDEVYELDRRGIGWTGRRRPADLLSAGDLAWFRLASPEEVAEAQEDAREGETVEPWVVLEQEPELEGAAVVLESATGAIRAMVGGWGFERSKFNRVTQARRQVGSAFKPFVFGAALETGFTPADTVFDGPAVFPGTGATLDYSPRNYYRRYYGILTLRRALELSINVSSVKLLDMVGVERVVDFARRCGIASPLPPYPSLALGSADLSPLELAAAYAAIANQGVYVEPFMIESVTDPEGRVVEEHLPRARVAAEPEVAFVLAQILVGVIDRGTGAAAADLEIDLAGKTGTTDAYTDAWFVGFSPRHTVLVWVGHDVKRTIGRRMTGAVAALPIWKEIVAAGLEDGWLTPGETFSAPPGVVRQPVEYFTGLLPGPGAERVIEETLVEGTGPVRQYEPRWGRVLDLPWFQQRPYYIPKEGERMPEDIPDWSAVERAWADAG